MQAMIVVKKKERFAMRQPNAVDFWRGFALITIFINHVPGLFYERFTHRNISLSDSADLFVFLAGWGLRYAVGRADSEVPIKQVVMRVLGRAVTLYAAQAMIVLIAIAMLGATARGLDNPLILEWINAAPIFYNPADAHLGLAMLSLQLGYFDILPLYVVLMLMAPVMVLVHRSAPNWLLPMSLALYLLAIVLRINLPTWPTRGQWFFNPLCWQLVFVLGFTLARERGPGRIAREHLHLIQLLAVPIILGCGVMMWFSWWPDPTKVPSPRLLFLVSKTYVTPLRLIQFLALVALFSAVYPFIVRHAGRVVGCLALLGRNSLHVFCAGSLLSLMAQIVRVSAGASILLDTVIMLVGISLLGFTAWLSEWRDRLGGKTA